MLLFLQRISYRMLLVISACVVCQNLTAAVFPIDVESELNGLNIIHEAYSIQVGSTVTLNLNNSDERKASCRATFDAKVVQRKTYNRIIEPGKTAYISYNPGRKVNRMNIKIVCMPE